MSAMLNLKSSRNLQPEVNNFSRSHIIQIPEQTLFGQKRKKIPSKLEVAPLYAKCGLDWMGEWIPLRLLRLLEHLAVLTNSEARK